MSSSDMGILISSRVDDDLKPVVVVDYKVQYLLAPGEARQLANDLLSEAAIADTEAALLKPKLSPGFSPEAKKKAVAYIAKLRKCRPEPRPKYANAIFGMRTQMPLVQVFIACAEGGNPWTLEVDEARYIAALLFHCAEAADTDAFLQQFLQADTGLTYEDVQCLLGRFQEFRDRSALQGMMQ